MDQDNMEEKKVNIRYARSEDYLWLAEHDKHIPENIVKNKIENMEFYVAEYNGKIVGWLRYNLFWDNVPFMNMIYFLEEYRKLGIGTKLIKYWENEMNKKGIKMY